MANRIDITGRKFGRLTAIRDVGSSGYEGRVWLCKCVCGSLARVTAKKLRSGNTKSCGCLSRDTAILRNSTHGFSGTRLYRIYHGMLDRCYRQNCTAFCNYGGRGVSVFADWKNSFLAFHEWALSSGYRDDLTLDRIDNNGNYEPSNCRWAPRSIQNRNTRRNRNVLINGETLCLKDACEVAGIKHGTVCGRMSVMGWSLEKAIEYKGIEVH